MNFCRKNSTWHRGWGNEELLDSIWPWDGFRVAQQNNILLLESVKPFNFLEAIIISLARLLHCSCSPV